ncbi:MAG: tetraacyldisaccharide 4'-kinase [Phycisphaerales bacterium]|jgi:tetraacyldisaccharide 4'-kinase|nr:tetraacyldisaccharide 4'-kinase [Phycisphaerales bacterium]
MTRLLRPASLVYGAAIALRNRRYDRGRGVVRTGVPVISVGNISVGGTGKTPMVQWVTAALLRGGHHPAIALRGYGAAAGGPSDEAMEHAGHFEGLPVLVDPDRVASIAAMRTSHPERDVVVLDDGFQHRRVARDLDVVLVDARVNLQAARLLPEGRLREPVSSLARATDVVLTHDGPGAEAAIEFMGRVAGVTPVARCRHIWTAVTSHGPDGACVDTTAVLEGCTVLTRVGVAHPAGIHDQLARLGAVVGVDLPAGDHAPVTEAEVNAMYEHAGSVDAVFVSCKDWVKLAPLVDLDRLGVPVLVPDLTLEFTEGEDRLRDRVLKAADTEMT